MCAHSSKYDSEITHYLHELTMISGHDEETGSCDVGDGWHGLFRGSFDVLADGAVDTEVIASLGAEDIEALTTCSGAIVSEDNQGFVYSDLYTDVSALNYAWSSAVDVTTHNVCDECGGEADYTGADQPVPHKPQCSERPLVMMMGTDMHLSELMYQGKLMRYADGGYPLAYITKDASEMCADCAMTNDETWPEDPIIGVDVIEESESGVYCVQCSAVIREADDTEPSEPALDDWTTPDYKNVYDRDSGKLLFSVPDGADFDLVVREHMMDEEIFPNLWAISDHGNAHLLKVWPEGGI